MKRLLNLPAVATIQSLALIQAPEPITIQDALYYLMFMQAIGTEVEQNGHNIMTIPLWHIIDLAKEHGGLVEPEFNVHNVHETLEFNQKSVFFIRLAHFTANLLKD